MMLALLAAWPAWATCPYRPTTTLQALRANAAALQNHMVTVEGVISASFLGANQLNGFFIQSVDLPAAGMFVYVPATYAGRSQIEVGQQILLRARLHRFKGRLELDRPDQLWRCGPWALTPIPVDLDRLDPAQLESLEGMLIQIPQATVIDNQQLGRYGSLTLASLRPLRVSARAPRIAALLLDDASYRANPRPVPYLDQLGTRRVGSRVQELTGVLAYAYGNFRLHPRQPPRFSDDNPRPPPLTAPAEASLRAASFNLENYFVTQGERGARNPATLQLQRRKLVPAIQGLKADLLSLMEVENEPAALQDLLMRINRTLPAVDRYEAVADSQHWGADAIRVAILFKPARLRFVRLLTDDTQAGFTRPPMLARFTTAQGQPLTVIAAHLKSKAGCPHKGDVDTGQGCWNQQRLMQAARARADPAATAGQPVAADHGRSEQL